MRAAQRVQVGHGRSPPAFVPVILFGFLIWLWCLVCMVELCFSADKKRLVRDPFSLHTADGASPNKPAASPASAAQFGARPSNIIVRILRPAVLRLRTGA